MPLIGAEALAVRPLALRGPDHEASCQGGVSASISGIWRDRRTNANTMKTKKHLLTLLIEWGAAFCGEKSPLHIWSNDDLHRVGTKSVRVQKTEADSDGNIEAPNINVVRSFSEARDFARSLRLSPCAEWRRYQIPDE
jgi:hypothetical protein